MEIFFSDIPEEGIPFTGKLAPAYFNLTEEDSIRITGDIEFDLTIYSFEEVAVLSGTINGPVELQCVTCLEFFPYEADFPSWQCEVDIEPKQASFDPRESIRDEIILSLPTTPHCDDTEERECPKSTLLAKFDHDLLITEPEPEPTGNAVWEVLDRLRKDE